jgi:hypothetical protein
MWSFDDTPTTEMISMEATTPVKPGSQMQIRYRINRFRQCDREVFRDIIDGDGQRHVLGTQSRPVLGRLGYEEYVQLIYVPETVAPGLGKYRVKIIDRCNPMHTFWPLVTYREAEVLFAQPSP